MSTETPPTPAASAATTQAPDLLRRYGRLWRDAPRDLGYLLPVLPIVIASCVVLQTVFWTGLGLVTILIGIPLTVFTLFVARGFGLFELLRLRGTRLEPIAPARWKASRDPRSHWFTRFFLPVTDGHAWLHLAHGAIVAPLVGSITWSVLIGWLWIGLGGPTLGLWARIDGLDPEHLGPFWRLMQLAGGGSSSGMEAGVLVVGAVAGVVALATLPLVMRGLVWVHWGIARGLLGAWRTVELEREVSQLTESRSAALAAEGSALRRLERDIHDGPQQRLVRLQMDLAAAERKLETDPAAARDLLAEALRQSRDALEELRALSRGLVPPILLDRGLVPALESLAGRAPVPTVVESRLPEGVDLPSELSRNLYFVAAEALANAAKHASAESVRVTLSLEGSGAATSVVLSIADDGVGGAIARPGHGLEGLEERMRGLGGTLDLASPEGGTVLTVRVPAPSLG